MFTVISKEISIQIVGGQVEPINCNSGFNYWEPECEGGRMKARLDEQKAR